NLCHRIDDVAEFLKIRVTSLRRAHRSKRRSVDCVVEYRCNSALRQRPAPLICIKENVLECNPGSNLGGKIQTAVVSTVGGFVTTNNSLLIEERCSNRIRALIRATVEIEIIVLYRSPLKNSVLPIS